MRLGLGAALAFLSCVVFVWASRETVRALPRQTALGRTALTTGLAALPGMALEGIPRLSGEAALLLLYFGIGSSALSQILWILSVGRLGMGLAGFHINAAPFYVMLMVAALGGAWSNWQALAAAMVALGVIVAQEPWRRS